MTLLMAVRLDDCILVGADGVTMDTYAGGSIPIVLARPSEKLQITSQSNLVFGVAGEGSTSTQIAAWMHAQHPTNWSDFASAIGTELARLNGLAASRYQLAGGRSGAHPYSDLLVAGVLNGQLQALKVLMGGDHHLFSDSVTEHFVGSGAGHADIAWRLAKRMYAPQSIYTEDAFVRILDAVVEDHALLGPPVSIIRATPDGELSKMR